MPMQTLTGTRLRERRLALGLRQSDLAERAGISGSYLNLIEHNRRRIAPELLARLAEVLGVDISAFEGGAGGGLIEELRAAAAGAPKAGAEPDRIVASFFDVKNPSLRWDQDGVGFQIRVLDGGPVQACAPIADDQYDLRVVRHILPARTFRGRR